MFIYVDVIFKHSTKLFKDLKNVFFMVTEHKTHLPSSSVSAFPLPVNTNKKS